MSSPALVLKGSNVLLSRPTFQADGTVLPPSTFRDCSCELVQKGSVVRTLVMGTDDELRANGDDTGLVLELTSAITDALSRGSLTERYKISIDDSEYVAEPDLDIKQIEITEVQIAE